MESASSEFAIRHGSQIFEDLKKVMSLQELQALYEKLIALRDLSEEGVSYPTHCLMSRIFWAVYEFEQEQNRKAYEEFERGAK
jgi:hypothetical protein